MWLIETVNNFNIRTWVSIFKAIEEEWILLWMWFIDDEMSLITAIQWDSEYLDKIESLAKIYEVRKMRKVFSLTKKEVLIAIKESLTNSLVLLPRFRKNCRYSDWLMDWQQVRDICQKYDNPLNPLVWILWDKLSWLWCKSIFQDDFLNLNAFDIKNWFNSKWERIFRKSYYLYKPWLFYINNCRDIDIAMYHPIIWYLLSTNWLKSFLDDKMLKDIDDVILLLQKKQDRYLSRN